MGIEKYNARILYDPSGTYNKGAEIPWFEFAEMIRDGELPRGTRVEKVAQNSRYRVDITDHHQRNCIVDEEGRAWTVVKNKYNNNGLAFKHKTNKRRQK